MAEESFMLLSLKEQQSKKLAQVIGSDTCRIILDFLANKEFSTETDAAKELGIPLSTVHYNMQALVKSGLVVADEFHYSDKGKEVPHYKLAKKYIIIAPKDDSNVLDKIKKFWPISALALGVAAIIEFSKRVVGSSVNMMSVPVADEAMAKVADAGVQEVAPMMARTLVENVSVNTTQVAAAAPLPEMTTTLVQETTRFPSLATLWFLGGVVFVILTMLVWEFVKRK